MAEIVPRYPLVLSILAALVTLGMKSIAWWWTGSVGLLSDAAESSINLLAATTALVCLWYAARPVDTSHTYGHEKIEYFSSGLEGILILLAALGIGWAAIERMVHQQPLEDLGPGTLLALGASLLNLAVARILIRVGKRTGSLLLEADGRHLMTDVWTSVGVVGALGLVWLTDWDFLDPLVALLVALNILWTALDLLTRSFNGLMDHALPMEEQALVRQAVEKTLDSQATYHALRTRQAGTRRFVDFHLLVPGDWSVRAAHELTERVEEAVRNALAGAEVTVHIEPIEEKQAWNDSALLGLEPEPRNAPGPGHPPAPPS